MQLIDLGKPRHVLFLGAHCDDIEIGCGGTIARLLETNPDVDMRWVVLSGRAERERETRQAASLLSEKIVVEVQRFRNGYFPSQVAELKDFFETLKDTTNNLVFTHFRDDLHQDHRVVSELTWNTFRDHLILEYEVVKYDGDLGNPALFVALGDHHLERKLEVLTRSFPSQSNKRWFDAETFRGVARIRGVQSSCSSGYAEAFYARKLVY